MTREGAEAKGRRYLQEGRLIVLTLNPPMILEVERVGE
jgi:hypothetical protein